MSSAETTHPIEWKVNGVGGKKAFQGNTERGFVARQWEGWAAAVVKGFDPNPFYNAVYWFREECAARSFVEKSVKEAGHGE